MNKEQLMRDVELDMELIYVNSNMPDKFKKEKVAILTTKGCWYIPYAKSLENILKKNDYEAKIFYNYKNINETYEVVFVMSYYKIITKKELDKHPYNIVIHESKLPKGKGWSPYFWKILEGKNKIPVTVININEGVDAGDVYIRDYIKLRGDELNLELRKIQAEKSNELALRFLKEYKFIIPKKQKGKETFYKRRTPQNSKLDINKSIKKQFNLLRISNNQEYPAFFNYKGNKYILKIEKAGGK